MAIVWILGILAVLVGAGVLIDRTRNARMTDLPPTYLSADQRRDARTERARMNAANGGGFMGFFGGDGGGGFGGGFDGGGGCGGDGGGGGSC